MAKEQGWGNFCSMIKIYVIRNDKKIIDDININIITSPRTSEYKNYILNKKYNSINLKNGDIVMLNLYAPYSDCMVGFKNVTVILNIPIRQDKPKKQLPTCNLKRGQNIYTGCNYVYALKEERDKQCNWGHGTSKWIGDDSNPCKMKRGQDVYLGCNYVYGNEKQRNKQCNWGHGTSKWIGDGLTY